MSAEFDLTFVGAQLQLWISFLITKAFTLCDGEVESGVPGCFDAFETKKALFWSRGFPFKAIF
ncbi:hypothetical protein NC653_025339 [Populus alba x Populus x berolinensis]|uniref:Uncharacterized protein n=1 Tax=Populus alba x Populus x berolinensis TaxID=444605 RepID=A0AAD6MBB7_9ROSI|nr:hypothetical protein NC653_025339 [Populus alba x Populus x berolinensis]